MAVLGVDDHRFLGLPDGALDRHEDRGRALVGQLIDAVRPDTILTFGPDGITFHPDHIAVHRWVTGGLGAPRPSRTPAVRHVRPPSTSPASASCTRSGAST